MRELTQQYKITKFVISREFLDHKILRIMLVTLLALYLYAPDFLFLPVNFNYLAILCALLYFSMGSNLNKLTTLLRSKIFLTFLYFYFFFLFYILLVPLFSEYDGYTTYFMGFLRLLIDIVLVIPFFVVVYKDELGFDLNKVLHDLVIIATIQGIIAAIMLAVPGLKVFAFSHIIKLPSEKLLSTPYRGFGISYDYFFSMPLFQSLALVLTTKFVFERGKRYLLCYPFILLSMVVNARVSILMIPVFLTVFFLTSFFSNDMRWLKRLVRLGLIFLGLILIVAIYFIVNPEDFAVILWSFGGIYDALMAVLGHGQSYTLNKMIIDFIHFPDNFSQLLFGEGLVVFGNPESPVMSDLGFIRYIYFGGLLFSLLVYLSLFNFHRSVISLAKDMHVKVFLISAGIMFLVAHFKGDAFTSTAFMKGIFLVQIFLLYDRQKQPITS